MKVLTGCFGFLFKIYIAIAFSVTLLLFYIPILLLKINPKTKKKTFRVFVIWSWTMRFLIFVHVRYAKKSKLPDGPYIIVSNHSSYLDIFLMFSILPDHPFLFLGKSEILSYPLVKSFFKDLHIPVYRKDRIKAAKSFIKSKQSLDEGWSLAIFPEGGIPDTRSPQMIPFKDGAFKLAKAAKVPIIPMTFANNYLLFSDPTDFLGPGRPGISKVYIHDFIPVETIQQLDVAELSSLVFDVVNAPLLEKKM